MKHEPGGEGREVNLKFELNVNRVACAKRLWHV